MRLNSSSYRKWLVRDGIITYKNYVFTCFLQSKGGMNIL